MSKNRTLGDSAGSDEIDLGHVLRVLKMNFRMIFLVTLFAMAAAWIYSKWIMKPYYVATALISPGSDGATVSGSLRSMVSQSPLSQLMNLGGGNESVNRYLEILRSRALSLQVIEKNSLLGDFKISADTSDARALAMSQEGLSGNLRHYVKSESNDKGMIRINYRNEKPELAFKVVDGYLKGLQEYLSDSSLNQSKITELFIQDRLREAQERLTQVEKDFVQLQKSRGVVQLPSQLGMSLNTASQLRAQIIQKEMEVELYKNIMKDSAEVHRLESEKGQLQSQLDKIVQGPGSTKARTNKQIEVFTPLSQGPSLEMQLSASEREYLTQVKLVELLRQQFELARIETKRTEPSFQVIDPPSVPLFPAGPNARLNSILAGVISFLVMVLFFTVVSQFTNIPKSIRGFVRVEAPRPHIVAKS